MKLVFVCSKFAGDEERNIKKAQGYCRFVVAQGHQPIAPHLHYPQFMEDADLTARALGMAFSRRLLELADEVWVFLGNRALPSAGMAAEIEYAGKLELRKPVLFYNDRCERINYEEVLSHDL